MPSYHKSSQKLWGTLRRKERWALSCRGWLLVTSAGLVATYFAFLNIHPFLAVTHRVNTNALVVEGWMPRYALRAGAEEFKNGSYERIFTTGGPENGYRGYINDYYTWASVAAEGLKTFGIPKDVIQMAPSHVLGRERTYSSAIALRDWFRDHNLAIHSFNVLTEDSHARRTQLLYKEAFGKNVTVGIIIRQRDGASRSAISLIQRNENSCCGSRVCRATTVPSICAFVCECDGARC